MLALTVAWGERPAFCLARLMVGGGVLCDCVALVSFVAFLVSSVALLAITVLLFCTMVFHKH